VIPTLGQEFWLDFVDHTYLGEYLPAGGSSVKFAVCYDGADTHAISEQIAVRATTRGFLSAHVSSEEVKVQLIEKLFGAIANQIPWDDLTTRVLCRFASEQHWKIPAAIDPSRGLVAQLDECNGLGHQQISLVLQQECGKKILGDRSLAKDFRVAMTFLARARLESGSHGEVMYQQITDWLAGRVNAISNMKSYQIYTKITRANARHLFGSLLTWVRSAGCPGLVATLDARRVVAGDRYGDGTLNYSTAAVLDAYEVLRQFIDATDEFDGFLLVVLMPPEFLELEAGSKGVGRYPALMGRIYDEVRDRNLANPYTALIRLGRHEEAA
jgi:hypothetical protein